MNQSHMLRPLLIVACLVVLSGCDRQTSPPSPQSERDERTEAALAELPAGDRDKARAQATCPVSGAALGSMGAPSKVTVGGREVFLCCEGCEPEITDHPEKYLAKLKGPARN